MAENTQEQLQAEITILKDLLEQSRNQIEFIHGCLTNPEYYSYNNPEDTEEFLDQLNEILPARSFCVHSKFIADCQGCQDREQHRKEVAVASKLLAQTN
jgi:hypothetical protein